MNYEGKLFLLSEIEFNKYKDKIPDAGCHWWLSDQGYSDEYAREVVSQEFVNYFCNINNTQVGVRPAYLIENSTSEEPLPSKYIYTIIWDIPTQNTIIIEIAGESYIIMEGSTSLKITSSVSLDTEAIINEFNQEGIDVTNITKVSLGFKYGITWVLLDSEISHMGETYTLYIAEMPIAFRNFDETTNIYNSSSIKQFVEDWQNERS